MLERDNLGTLPDFEHLSSVGARFVRYKSGMRVYFKAPAGDEPTRGDSAAILDQSDASRRRAAFALGNAECDWLAMSTLTHHHPPTVEVVVRQQEQLSRACRNRWGEPLCGWIKEFQQRGVIHYHLFHSAQSIAGQSIALGERGIRESDGREISRGGFDYWLRSTWLKISGQLGDRDAAWQHGRGIVEFFDSPDAAGRYVAKEAAKREQKILPAGYEKGIGRWWNLARKWRPVPRGWGALDLHRWPWYEPCSQVWNGEVLAECITDYHAAPKGLTNVTGWLQLNGFAPTTDECEPCAEEMKLFSPKPAQPLPLSLPQLSQPLLL